MSDALKFSDALDDLVEQGEYLVTAIKEIKISPPVVNVAASDLPPPTVNVHPPAVNIQPPNINLPESQSWEFEITGRDLRGFITKFTAKPIK